MNKKNKEPRGIDFTETQFAHFGVHLLLAIAALLPTFRFNNCAKVRRDKDKECQLRDCCRPLDLLALRQSIWQGNDRMTLWMVLISVE